MTNESVDLPQGTLDLLILRTLALDGLFPPSTGARISYKDGKPTVTDGPFAESKEVIGGFAILQADSKEKAIEYLREFLQVAGDGECELRQVYEQPAA